MATLDGSTIEVGDSVYDIRNDRYGQVESVNGAIVRVMFQGNIVSYGDNGTIPVNGMKALYWCKPAISTPRKGYEAETKALQIVLNSIQAYKVGA